jgi:iron(III) transport system ATP-binding protein
MYEFPGSEFVAGFMGEAMLFPGEAAADGSVTLGPLTLVPKQKVGAGKVKIAVRPEAWRIGRAGENAAGKVEGRLIKRSYLGNFYEYTFDTALGQVFVVSPNLTDILEIGADAGLSLADHGVSVVKADAD